MQRIAQVSRHLSTGNQQLFCIGQVCVPVVEEEPNEIGKVKGIRVPHFTLTQLEEHKELLQDLQWIMKKDLLDQNILLIGPPGPLKRRLVETYASLKNQSLEVITLHPDISSESDLKQRREITARGSDELVLDWQDGPIVQAAIQGGMVVLDGAERAERNVLPVINNLLENKEMHLEDGRRIVSATVYDDLLKSNKQSQLDQWGLIRAHERFRVIALAAPTPKFKGKSMDPPFRSRFQARHVEEPQKGCPITVHQQFLFANNEWKRDSDVVQKLNMLRQALAASKNQAKLTVMQELAPEFDQCTLEKSRLLERFFPLEFKTNALVGLARYYSASFLPKPLSENQEKALNVLLKTFDLPSATSSQADLDYIERTFYVFEKVEGGFAHFSSSKSASATTLKIPVALGSQMNARKEGVEFVKSPRCMDLIARMIQCHALFQDILLIGPKSSSKSICVREFARILNYDLEILYLFKEMTARDLLQRRATRQDGSTTWADSLLTQAAKEGKIVVLEGLQWLSSSVSVTLSSLLQNREIRLPDGSLLTNELNYRKIKAKYGNVSDEEMKTLGVFCIHPSFRVIGIVTTESSSKNTKAAFDWYTEEVGGMFACLQVDGIGSLEERLLMETTAKCPVKKFNPLMSFVERIRSMNHSVGHASILSNSVSLSTRQILRICQRAAFPNSDLYSLINDACLGPFMSSLARKSLEELLQDVHIKKSSEKSLVEIVEQKDTVLFGDVLIPKYKNHDHESRSLVPRSSGNPFFDNQSHSAVMRDLAVDFSLGEHLLLIGNQGVGKNKIVDQFLQILEYPREYMQLHRDTTVQSLLFQPILQNGKIVHVDSPLIKAIKGGRAIIIDEADKAPVHVIAALKSLAEDGCMNLPDGRKIVPSRSKEAGKLIPIHPSFRMIVLANRPGFPFLGNDFYSSIGEAFACYPVQNPSFDAEVSLLTQMAPSVKQSIPKLVGAFQELRSMFDENVVSYPYSLRELINIVRHLERFPDESLESVLRNVFDFDAHRPDIASLLLSAFKKHGLDLEGIGATAISSKFDKDLAIKFSGKAPAELTDPKFGKVDPKNDPHVGGNTWAGGTGGSSTAGLGGRGGPYRLDSGNPIHQLPDNLKNEVPQKVLDSSRKQGQDALKKRLEEISMSAEQERFYSDLYQNVQSQIQQLRTVLESVEAKEKERVWIRHQSEGELDESRLVEGVTGEKAIYKKRGVEDNNFGPQTP